MFLTRKESWIGKGSSTLPLLNFYPESDFFTSLPLMHPHAPHIIMLPSNTLNFPHPSRYRINWHPLPFPTKNTPTASARSISRNGTKDSNKNEIRPPQIAQKGEGATPLDISRRRRFFITAICNTFSISPPQYEGGGGGATPILILIPPQATTFSPPSFGGNPPFFSALQKSIQSTFYCCCHCCHRGRLIWGAIEDVQMVRNGEKKKCLPPPSPKPFSPLFAPGQFDRGKMRP